MAIVDGTDVFFYLMKICPHPTPSLAWIGWCRVGIPGFGGSARMLPTG